MAQMSARSRKWRARALQALRAAAFLSIATGINRVLETMYPGYEPIYAYLVAVLVVAWLGSALLGVTAAVAAAILYDWMFAPVRVVPSMSLAIPLTFAVAVAIATRAARVPLERRALPEPAPQPLLPVVEHEPAPRVDILADDTRLRELQQQVTELKRQLAEARMHADDEDRAHGEERAAFESRQAQRASEIDALRQQIVERGGQLALVRREADALAQRLTESEARAERETSLRKQLETAGQEALQKTVAELSSKHEAALAEAKQRTDAAAKKHEALQKALANERARADRQSAEYAAALAERQKGEALQKTVDELTAKHEAAMAELKERAAALEKALANERARADRQSGEYAAALAEKQKGEALQKTIDELTAKHESAMAELKERADAAAKRAAALQTAVSNERARADRDSGEFAKAIAAAAEKTQALERDVESLRKSLNEEHARAEREASLRAQLETAARETLKKTAVVSSAHQRDAAEAREAARAADERAREAQREIERVRAAAQEEIGAAKQAIEQETVRVAFEAAARQKAADEAAALQQQMEDERERFARQEFELNARMEMQRDEMNREFDVKLQKIVDGLAHDHENAVGDALLEREAARAEVRRLTQRTQELEQSLLETRSERERLDSEWNAKLEKIVAHLTEDHEADVGEAMLQREAARAEVRNLTAKLAVLQKQIDDEREKFRQFALRRSAATPSVEQRMPTLEKARPRVVLVVHSDAGVRAMAKHTLQQDGYIVLTAADGLEGLRTAGQNKPDIVLAEPVMPKMNARELVQLLKSKRETADVKIILMAKNGEIGRGADFTADDVIRNPADFNELRTTLANVLARGVTS